MRMSLHGVAFMSCCVYIGIAVFVLCFKLRYNSFRGLLCLPSWMRLTSWLVSSFGNAKACPQVRVRFCACRSLTSFINIFSAASLVDLSMIARTELTSSARPGPFNLGDLKAWSSMWAMSRPYCDSIAAHWKHRVASELSSFLCQNNPGRLWLTIQFQLPCRMPETNREP